MPHVPRKNRRRRRREVRAPARSLARVVTWVPCGACVTCELGYTARCERPERAAAEAVA